MIKGFYLPIRITIMARLMSVLLTLANQFSRLQDARSHQGGAALVVYFKGQKVVDIFYSKKSQERKIGNPML